MSERRHEAAVGMEVATAVPLAPTLLPVRSVDMNIHADVSKTRIEPPSESAVSDSGSEEAKIAAAGQSLLAALALWWPLLLGNMLEWYEFCVYGYVAEQMQKNFFAGSALGTWMGFTVTFLSRPFGGILLGRMADRWGRQPVAVASMIGMTVATVAQGLLPVGTLGAVLLVCLRLLQGISAGGEVCAVVCFLVESAPRRVVARATALMAASVLVAFMIASGTVAILAQHLGPERMLSWGWRLPFLFVLPPSLVALAGRRRLAKCEPDAPECNSEGRAGGGTRAALRELWSKKILALLVGFFGSVAFATLFYVGPIWTLSYLKNRGMEPTTADWVGFLTHAVELVFALFGSYLADMMGAGSVTLVSTVAITLVGLPGFAFLQANPTSMLAALLCVSLGFGSACGLASSCIHLFCAELFPQHIRALGFGLSFNMAVTYFGGCGGLLAQALTHVHPLAPGFYLSAAGLISTVAVLAALWLHKCGRLTAHLRPELYFSAPCTREKGSVEASDAEASSEGTSEFMESAQQQV